MQGFFVRLDEANYNTQLALRAVYTVYITNPCELHDYLTQETKKILEDENILRRFQLEIRQIELSKSEGLDKNALEEAIKDSLSRLSQSEEKLEISNEFQQAKKIVSAW